MTSSNKHNSAPFQALENALILDQLGYVCTPATTLETVVAEYAPVKGADGKYKRDANGVLVKVLQRVDKPAKLAIGSWGDAEPGIAATTRRFKKQLDRVLEARTKYGVEQDADNLGVAIITSKSGIVVVDDDTGKMPDPNNPGKMLDPHVALDILLTNILKTAGIPESHLTARIAWFKRQVHVRTPSGGWHFYFRRKDGQRPRMHTGMVEYVDIRAGFKNSAGKWESSGLAYAPRNVTLKGRYIRYEVAEDGQPVERETLPAVSDLPKLPDQLNALFEKSTREIRDIAVGLGIPVPDTARTDVHCLHDKGFRHSRNGAAEIGDMSKWDRLAEEFVRSTVEDAGEVE